MFGAFALTTQAIGGAFSAYNSYKSAKIQAAYQEAEARQQYLNAAYQSKLEEYNAQQTAHAGGIVEYEQYRQQNQRRATMQTQFAANGVALEGTAVDLLAEQARADAENNYYLREQYANQYQQHMINAMSILSEGKSNYASGMASASITRATGRANAVTSLLGTASGVGMNAYNLYGASA